LIGFSQNLQPLDPIDMLKRTADMVRARVPGTSWTAPPFREALLDLVVHLGVRLRRRGRAARAPNLTLEFTGGTS
jgi:hypothetical protein